MPFSISSQYDPLGVCRCRNFALHLHCTVWCYLGYFIRACLTSSAFTVVMWLLWNDENDALLLWLPLFIHILSYLTTDLLFLSCDTFAVKEGVKSEWSITRQQLTTDNWFNYGSRYLLQEPLGLLHKKTMHCMSNGGITFSVYKYIVAKAGSLNPTIVWPLHNWSRLASDKKLTRNKKEHIEK